MKCAIYFLLYWFMNVLEILAFLKVNGVVALKMVQVSWKPGFCKDG